MINISIILIGKYMILYKTSSPFYTFYTFYKTIERL